MYQFAKGRILTLSRGSKLKLVESKLFCVTMRMYFNDLDELSVALTSKWCRLFV